MADFALKLIEAFRRAKSVTHYYWEHTPHSGAAMSVENIQHIIELMTRLKVEKFSVDFPGNVIRGNYERYADRAVIHVRKSQSPEWVRFTIVKELCHVLIDKDADFSTDAEATIRELVEYSGLATGDHMSNVMLSERIAEIIALELVYPFEYRDQDAAAVAAGAQHSAIAATRLVPSIWIQRALSKPYLESCRSYWAAITSEPTPPLTPL